MISESDIATIESTDPQGRWYVHDGFDGWSYGSPLNPTPITRACAFRLLSHMIEERHPDAVSKLADFPNALDYADENDDLYLKTGGNRLIAYLNPVTYGLAPKLERDYDV